MNRLVGAAPKADGDVRLRIAAATFDAIETDDRLATGAGMKARPNLVDVSKIADEIMMVAVSHFILRRY